MNEKELDRKERKRLQNRVAQRIYRQTQKERIQALEAVIAQVAPFPVVSPVDSQVPANGTEHFAEQNRDETRAEPVEIMPSFQDSDWDASMSNGSSFLLLAPPQPPLHRAVRKGNESMARLLLKHGADVTKSDVAGNTALHLAAELGREDIMKLLLDHAADPGAVNYLGHTVLLSAVQSNNEVAAKFLLEGASVDRIDVNWESASGTTTLHLAVECGFESMASLLIGHGADVDA